MSNDKSLTDVLKAIASIPMHVPFDPMFNYADDLAWQHQLQLEQQRREEEDENETP